MPGFVHHTLLISLRERQNKVITSGMVLEPAESVGVLKALGKVGFRNTTITKINGVTSAVLGVTRWCRYLGTFLCSLITFRGHIKKNGLLQSQRSKPAEQAEIDSVCSSRTHHRVEGLGCLQIQFNPRLKHNELISLRFAIREVPQQASIRIGTFTKA